MGDEQLAGQDVVVVVPTYNERDNLPRLVGQLYALGIAGLRVLVVDDASPDGTGEIADALCERTAGFVQVLHRHAKEGLGRAYVAGMQLALACGATVIVQMDADLSHPAVALPGMLGLLHDPRHQVVVGSRYVAGGGVSRSWPLSRRALSKAANFYIDAVLDTGVRDATSGFKAWRSTALRTIDLRHVASDGFGFQIEMAYACRRLNLGVAEFPIRFEQRGSGTSKMTTAVQWEALWLPWRLRKEPLDRTDILRETATSAP